MNTAEPKDKKTTDATVDAIDVSPEVFRDLMARSVTLAGLAVITLMVLGLAGYRIGVLLHRLAEWAPF